MFQDEMNLRRAGLEPFSREAEPRALHVLHAEHVDIELPAALEIFHDDCHVIKTLHLNRHRRAAHACAPLLGAIGLFPFHFSLLSCYFLLRFGLFGSVETCVTGLYSWPRLRSTVADSSFSPRGVE